MNDANTNESASGQPFSLPTENELLMLKLQAEFGARCIMGNKDLPPEVVNNFLKSVYHFERKLREPRQSSTIYERIGAPLFPEWSSLSTLQAGEELSRLLKALREKRIELDILGDYGNETLYRFVTEEFFQLEMNEPDIDGFVHHFCYEDFYPNHEMDITQRCTEFITQWLQGKINEYSWELAETFIHPDSRMYSKASVLKKINLIYKAFEGYSKSVCHFDEMTFEWDDRLQAGKAFVEGWISYCAKMDRAEEIKYNGPFQFYLANNEGWWSIYYFVFPGFSWNDRWPE